MRFVMVELKNFGPIEFTNRKLSKNDIKSEDLLSYKYLDTNKLNVSEINNFIKKNCNKIGKKSYPVPLLSDNDYEMIVISGFTVLYSMNDVNDTKLVLFDLNHYSSRDILSILRDRKISDINKL